MPETETRSDLIRRMQEYITRVASYIRSEDPIVVILKVQLVVEAEIDQDLGFLVLFPEALDLQNRSYKDKLKLAVALGAIPEDAKKLFISLYKVRNKIAHDVDARVNLDDVHAIRGAMSGEQKAYLNSINVKLSGPKGSFLEAVRTTVWAVLQVTWRHGRECARKHDERVALAAMHGNSGA